MTRRNGHMTLKDEYAGEDHTMTPAETAIWALLEAVIHGHTKPDTAIGSYRRMLGT